MIGRTISHYKILEEIGGGGMGVVYKAEDTKLHRSVALKFLPPELTSDETAKTRFIHEAQAASALDHQNIAVVHEIDETDDGQSFICMAYYEGDTLKERIEKGPVEIGEVVRIGSQVADGLHRAHEAGIVHRDIKPANLILTNRGDVKIVDFGIAKLGTGAHVTKTQTTAGTAAYMSPEQAMGKETDQRSDLFSFGVVLYELVTGQRPFIGEHEPALFYSIVNMDPTPPSKIRTDIPPGLEGIILKLLEKDPASRYQSALDLKRELRRLHGMTESTRQIIVSAARPGNRFLTYILAGLVAVLLLISLPGVRVFLENLLGIKATPVEVRLSVLQFTNIGGDSTGRVFCDGLMESLTSKLTQLRTPTGTLWVAASSEVRTHKVSSAEQARRLFGVNLVVAGSYQRASENVTITLNLVDTETSQQVDSRVITDRQTSLAGLQDKMVEAVVSMLEIPVAPASMQLVFAGNTTVSDAFKFYIEGRGHLYNYQKLGNIDLAIQLFELSLKEDSTYALAYSGLGEAYWRKYELSRDVRWIDIAIASGRRGVELNENLPAVRVTLAITYAARGRYNEAITEYEKVLETDTANADAYRGLASTFYSQGNFEQAEHAYKKAIGIRPSYWAGYSDLGTFYYLRKKYADALEQFKRVVDLTKDNPIGYRAMGSMFLRLEKPDSAEQAFKKSIAVEPTYAVYNNLGTLYFEQGRFKDVIPVYEKALAMNDRDYRVWGGLASAYHWMGEREKSKEPFEKAISIAESQRVVNPRDATILSHLADYNSMLGKKSDALNLIETALAAGPGDLDVIRRAADVYEQVGNRDLALSLIEEGLKKGIPRKEFDSSHALKQLRTDRRYLQLMGRYGKKP